MKCRTCWQSQVLKSVVHFTKDISNADCENFCALIFAQTKNWFYGNLCWLGFLSITILSVLLYQSTFLHMNCFLHVGEVSVKVWWLEWKWIRGQCHKLILVENLWFWILSQQLFSSLWWYDSLENMKVI